MAEKPCISPNPYNMCNDLCPMRTECRIEFNHINERLNDGSETFGDHSERLRSTEIQVTRLSEAMANQTQSMDRLTKSIENQNKIMVSVAMTLMTALFGFFMWYVKGA